MSFIKKIIYYLLLPVFLACTVWYVTGPDNLDVSCHEDYSLDEALICRPQCEAGEFSLPWMDKCRKWLTCSEIESNDFEILEPIGNGAVKKVHKARWGRYIVAYNHIMNDKYKPDFKHGLTMLAKYQPSPYVTQLLGYCKTKFVTEYHQFRSADLVDEILSQPLYKQYDTLETRFGLCVNYVEIINFLHTGPQGTRVMCDSNDVHKALNQFLLTNDFKLVVNDLDALPLVDKAAGKTIKCGHRELYGDFVAPEQLWPHDDLEFNDSIMPGYDEKTDIWKIPDVCEHLLASVPGSDPVRFKLFKIHQACKQVKPEKRPDAAEVLAEYVKVQEEFDLL